MGLMIAKTYEILLNETFYESVSLELRPRSNVSSFIFKDHPLKNRIWRIDYAFESLKMLDVTLNTKECV